jgi:CheY-like chemotaxis protein
VTLKEKIRSAQREPHGASAPLGIPQAATVPIIAMTTNVFMEDIEKCLQTEMNAHIGKPMNLAETIQVMGKLLLKQKIERI